MPNDEPIGREVLLTLATAPFAVFLAQAGDARAQVGVKSGQGRYRWLGVPRRAPMIDGLKDLPEGRLSGSS